MTFKKRKSEFRSEKVVLIHNFVVAQCETNWLFCNILSESCKMIIMQDSSKTNGYLARFLEKALKQKNSTLWRKEINQDLCENELSKNLEQNQGVLTYGIF